jgi:hypothetical protein
MDRQFIAGELVKVAKDLIAKDKFKSEFMDSGRDYSLTVNFKLDSDAPLSEQDVFQLLKNNWRDITNKADEKWWDGDRVLSTGDGTVKTLNIKDVRGFDFEQNGRNLLVDKIWKSKELDSRKKLFGKVGNVDVRFVEKGGVPTTVYRFGVTFNKHVSEDTVNRWLFLHGWGQVESGAAKFDRLTPEGWVAPLSTTGLKRYPFNVKEQTANRYLVEAEIIPDR